LMKTWKAYVAAPRIQLANPLGTYREGRSSTAIENPVAPE